MSRSYTNPMKCEKCEKDFSPRDAWDEGNKITRGYNDIVEIAIKCPHCDAPYSHWVEPTEWHIQEGFE